MFTAGLIGSLALFASTDSSSQAENCVAAGEGAQGETWTAPVRLDWTSGGQLVAAALPRGTSGIACPRASVVPLSQDIRVLSELGVSLALIEEGGRALWIWSQNGVLQTTVEHGELRPEEVAAVSRWSVAAQPQFERRAPRR